MKIFHVITKEILIDQLQVLLCSSSQMRCDQVRLWREENDQQAVNTVR